MCVLVVQSCSALCDPMDCSLPGSSVHGILQARILEWVAISFSRGSSWSKDWTRIPCIVGRFFTTSQQESLNTIVLMFKLLQSCPALCDPVDCALPSSSVHGILQAKIPEWVAMPFSRWSSPSKGWTWVSCIFCITGRFFTAESPGKSQLISYFTVNRNYFWASLVVQWLRIHLAKKKKEFTLQCKGCWFHPWSRKILCVAEQLNQYITTTEPYAATTEANTPRACAPQQEKLPQWEARTVEQRVAHAYHK